jgi:hypothetical protein
MRKGAALLVLATAFVACGKGKAPNASVPSAGTGAAVADSAVSIAVSSRDDAADGMDAMEAAQWAAAKDGDPEELMRLAALVGCEGLHERASQDALRATALQAARYCDDFSELPWLAQVGQDGNDADARAALDAAVELAARPRRSVDPEDADDLHVGCTTLLGLALAPDRPRERRVLAVRALRMLSEYGCVKRGDIPIDFDPR